MKKIPSILIDKSWLDGTNQQIVQNLGDKYNVVIPDCLFYEIMTDEKKDPKILLSKLALIKKSIISTEGLGYYLRKEIDERSPCENIFAPKLLKILEWYLESNNTPSQKILKRIEGAKKNREEELSKDFSATIRFIADVFKDIDSSLENSSKDKMCGIIREVIQDRTLIIKHLKVLSGNVIDDSICSSIDNNWIWYRFSQAMLAYSLDECRANRVQSSSEVCKNIKHNLIDMDYVVLATKCDGLACSDDLMKNVYLAMCPGKLILNRNQFYE